MQPFTRLAGSAAALMEENIDTDIIYPARFLLITSRDGLGKYAFHDRRFDADGNEVPDFVLNRGPWRQAPILVTAANFGSGSSREHAVWTLMGQGIRCVIAPSFGEIFMGNCFRNGLLPIVLPAEQVEALGEAAMAESVFEVDLEAQSLTIDGNAPIHFAITPERKLALLNGWDETGVLLNTYGQDITAYEGRHRDRQPWLFDQNP
ncbi:MAG: 3-isopropylmalate dehydratase small subunit [Azospirillaceae bacterium]|nr:3-isopropylmalate dehydratase small subunit [Azospirillaceae bacterium]